MDANRLKVKHTLTRYRREELLKLSPEAIIDKLLPENENLKNQNEELFSKIDELFDRLSSSQAALKAAKAVSIQEEKLLNGVNQYNKGWKWIDKIIFLIEQAKFPLQVMSICDLLRKNDAQSFVQLNDARHLISNMCNRASKFRRLIAIKVNGTSGLYYALPAWIEDGQLKSQYNIDGFEYYFVQ